MSNPSHTLGYFGNIWVRQNELTHKGDFVDGHKHTFDHISLVTHGSVLVEVEGFAPKIFHAPTFIVIKREHEHKFTAASDDVVWYCVFAMRDVNGEVVDIYGEENSPYLSSSNEFADKIAALQQTSFTDK